MTAGVAGGLPARWRGGEGEQRDRCEGCGDRGDLERVDRLGMILCGRCRRRATIGRRGSR